MMEQMEREALDRLLDAIDRADLANDPTAVWGNEGWPKAYGIAQYRVADIRHAAAALRRAMRREVSA